MRSRPDGLDPGDALLSWGIDARSLEYLPVGFGDHHFDAVDGRGLRWFVTVADLAHKAHCGVGVAAARDGLTRAMDTAAALDLDFVVAPVPTSGGATVCPLGERYAVSVFPYLAGSSGRFGDEPEPVTDLLTALHRAPPPSTTPVHRPELPDRAGLEAALAALDRPWTGGPFGEPARALVSDHLTTLRRRLVEFDRRVDELRGEAVVTHGEPHPGNVLRVGDRRLLVDWDTVGLAVPERDLWLLDPAHHDGRPSALALYRLRWQLDDVSAFLHELRAPHTRTADTEQAWTHLVATVRELAA